MVDNYQKKTLKSVIKDLPAKPRRKSRRKQKTTVNTTQEGHALHLLKQWNKKAQQA